MKNQLFENTRRLAYFLWEYTNCENALSLWYCSEDLTSYFEINSITSMESLQDLLDKGKKDPAYIAFIRNIAFRLYLYTGQINQKHNWYLAESLASNIEWCRMLVESAAIYSNIINENDILKSIRSDTVRNYYKEENHIE